MELSLPDNKTTTLQAAVTPVPEEPRGEGRWLRWMTSLGWYSSDMPSEEKRLVLRLDLSILAFGCLSFFTKYLDQQSLTNAYVSGMREELHFQGNQLNYVTATFWASYCTAMIPACYYLTHYPANLVLPGLELGWGLCTFVLAWARNVDTVYAMRFLTGLFECCSFTGTIYVIGSWYKPHEIGRRVSLFYVSAPLGTMFAGYLQAAAYTNLNHAHGLAGWRWLFIVDAVITLPIALVGFFIFPDVPSRSRPRLISAQQHALAQARLQGVSEPPRLRLSRTIFRRVLGRWHFYLFVLMWCMLDQNGQAASQTFSLYLKAKPAVYSVVRVNTLPTITTAVSVVTALICGVVADATGGRFWLPALAITLPVIVGTALLTAYASIGEKARLAAFYLIGFEGGISPMTMGWASVVMRGDAEERAVVTAAMNAIGQGIMAGTQVVQYPASKAPNFHGGWCSALVTAVTQLFVILVILVLATREASAKQKELDDRHDGDSEEGSQQVVRDALRKEGVE